MSGYFSSLGLNQADIMSIVNTANMQGAYASAMMNPSYMTGSIFNSSMPSLPSLPTNIDMNMSLSTPAWMQNVGTTPAQFDFSGLNTSNPFSSVAVGGAITDEDGEKLTMSEYAKKHGYEETMTDGVYKKGGKYYRYNGALKRFAEISKSEKAQVEKAEREAKNAEKAEKYKATQKANKSKIEAEAKSLAADIYDSIDGWGTNDSKLKRTVESINKDNVIEVWEMWERNHEDDFGEGNLIKSIADDTSGSDLKKYQRQIKDALTARAEALGLTEEAAQARETAPESFDFEAIVKAIRNKERE